MRCYSQSGLADPVYMKEYADLKELILGNTRKSGGAIAAYLLVTVDGEASLCALFGMLFSNVYLLWLFRDVDAVTGTDYVPMAEALKVESPVARYLAMWVASYFHALRPRLLVPISLAALMAAYNTIAEVPLNGFCETSLLLGFLSHKVALLLKIVDDVSPKGFATDSLRPRVDRMDEDAALNLDQWGRPMKATYKMPTEALPEDVDPEDLGPLPKAILQAAKGVEDDPIN